MSSSSVSKNAQTESIAHSDAIARAEQAAQEFGCSAASLRPFSHFSDADLFFETTAPSGQKLFLKSHLGSPQTLQAWTEPASARWAQRAGCGARVFDSKTAGVLITERLPGRPMTRAEGSDPFFVRQVVGHLFRLHHSEQGTQGARIPSTTGGARGRLQEIVAANKISQALAAQLMAKADWIDAQMATFNIDTQRRFGDCHFGNWVVVDKQLYAIDLANSAFDDPLADLARYAYCQRFDHAQLQNMLTWYCEHAQRAPTQQEKDRLRLHATAQNLDYFGFFTSLSQLNSPQTRDLAQRVMADEAQDSGYPRADFAEVFQRG